MKRDSNQKPSILVIGAGLGGLGLANGLMKSGFNVRVFERDQNPISRAQGYRITMRSLGMTALSELLSPSKLKQLPKARVADVGSGITFADENMQTLLKITSGMDTGVQFLRSELRAHLLEGVKVEWNKQLTKFEDTGKQVTACFHDGSQATGDLLVACDGGTSIVRELIPRIYKENLGSIPTVVNTDTAVFTAQVDRTPEWEKLLPEIQSGMVQFLGPSSSYLGVCFSERVDRSPTIFWGLAEKIEDRNSPLFRLDQTLQSHKRILEHCKTSMEKEPWHDTLKKLIRETPAEGILTPWVLRTTKFPAEPHSFPLVPTARVTLLGDAAHAMSPGQGLGGSHVLEDARLLSSLLSASPSPIHWRRLIADYERQMFARVQKAVQDSEQTAKSHKRLRGIKA